MPTATTRRLLTVPAPVSRPGWPTSLAIGGTATVAAMATMFWLRTAYQIRTLPERVMEWVLLFVSPDALEQGLAQFGAQAKVYALYVAVAGMAAILLATGAVLIRYGRSPWAELAVGPALYLVAMGGIMPITFLARHDVADWPALGQLARIYGTLFIERGRLRQIPSINRQMALRLERGETVGLFPEATTGDGTRLKKFSAVHFAAARSLLEMRPDLTSVDIAPVVIAYTRRSGLPLGRAGRAAVAWYGDMEFAPHLLDLARGGAVECRIRFLTPIPFDRSSDRKKLARLAGDAIRFEKASLISGAAESAPAYVLSGSQSV